MIIFGTSVTEKVGNQNILYFPTSPNLCFCTTWGNRKPKNCVFSLQCCMLFLPKTTWHTLKYYLVTADPPFTVKTIDRMHQTGPGIVLSVTHMLYVNQDCHAVGHCVKDGSCSSSSLSESRRTVLMGYLTITVSTVVLNCCKGDKPSQWEYPIFGPCSSKTSEPILTKFVTNDYVVDPTVTFLNLLLLIC